MITLKRALRIADYGDAWTIGTDGGEGWVFYFDGKLLHTGTDIPFEEFLERNCLEFYERGERKHLKFARLPEGVCELEAGLAFVVEGHEDGTI